MGEFDDRRDRPADAGERIHGFGGASLATAGKQTLAGGAGQPGSAAEGTSSARRDRPPYDPAAAPIQEQLDRARQLLVRHTTARASNDRDKAKVVANELRTCLHAARAELERARPSEAINTLRTPLAEMEHQAARFLGEDQAADPAAIAARGTSDPGQQLPHLAQIQASFGPEHDLRGIRAHVGEVVATGAFGAEAFASGEHVAFRSPDPALHTVAHEAAHIVQQRAGVALKGGIDGGSGDVYEQHADRVADAVVTGKSAAPILDQMAGKGATALPSTPVVQRRVAEKAPPEPAGGAANLDANNTDLSSYAQHFANNFQQVIAAQLVQTAWPDPAPGLRWAPGGQLKFMTALLHNVIVEFQSGDETKIVGLLKPSNVVGMFRRNVEIHDAVIVRMAPWSPAFGMMVAGLVEHAALSSLKLRVGPRYRQAVAQLEDAPSVMDLSLSGEYPMDLLVAIGLTTFGAIDRTQLPTGPDAPAPVGKMQGDRRPAEQATVSNAQLADVDRKIGAVLENIQYLAGEVGVPAAFKNVSTDRAHRTATIVNGDDAARAPLVPEILLQHIQLISIKSRMAPVVQALKAAHDDASAAPLREMVARYVEAADISYRIDESTAITDSIAMDSLIENDANVSANIAASRKQDIDVTGRAATGSDAAEQAAEDQRQADIAGTATDRNPYKRTQVDVEAGEAALRSQMEAVAHWLSQLEAAAKAAGFDSGDELRRAIPSAAMSVGDLLAAVRFQLADVTSVWAQATRDGRPQVQEDPDAPSDWAEWQARAAGLTAARQAFAAIGGKQEISTLLNDIVARIHHKEMVNAAIHLLEALVLTVVTGIGAAAFGDAIAGALLGTTEGWLASGIAAIAGAPINMLAQAAVSGGDGSPAQTTLEYGLMDFFARRLMAPFAAAQRAALMEAQKLTALPHLEEAELRALKNISFTGAELTLTVISTAASQWAAHQIVTLGKSDGQMDGSLAATLLQQGAAIGLGKFFHGRLAAWNEHRAALAKTRLGKLPQAHALFEARDAFFAKAAALEKSVSPDPSEGPALQAEDLSLIKQEKELVANDTANVRASSAHEGYGAKPSGGKAMPSGDAAVKPEEKPTKPEQSATERQGAPAKPDEHAAKPDEHAAKPDEHAAKPDEHAAKPDEHAAKPDEHQSKRVTAPVPGLYDSIDPRAVPKGWHFNDDGPRAHPEHRGWLQIRTTVEGPDGTSGLFERSYDPKKKMVVMENAFLRDLPAWIQAGTPLKSGRGTPTVAYMTMRHMKMFGLHFGETKIVKMSTIQNVEAVMQLEHMKRNGHSYDEAVAKTHSVEYATTSIQQSGQVVTGVRIDVGAAFQWKLSEMMDWFKMPNAERRSLLEKYQLTSDDTVLANYDIYIDLAPYSAK